jgi:phenylpropionate dioxygenase-like ring-hydroxylating dioxygenase large terminal subunit
VEENMVDLSQKEIDKKVSKRLNLGLLNKWHPVLPSYKVQNELVGITRLSEKIVLWRDEKGNLSALEDRCPHRGARLSLGWNLGDNIACWYHGIELDGSGMIKCVPASKKSSMEGKKIIKSYPVKEIEGAIFLYFGDQENPEPCDLTLPEELTSGEFSNFLCTAMWNCNYRYAIDNVMDPMHGAYLHAASHSMAFGDKEADMQIVETKTGLVFEKVGQRDVNFDWVEISDTGGIWMRLSIPYRKNAGPGGSFFIVGFATPVDETHCQVFFWRARRVTGWQKDIWRFMYRNRLEKLHWEVLEQDRIILQNMADNARENELLYDHDKGLARVRRMLKKKAHEQISKLSDKELVSAEL